MRLYHVTVTLPTRDEHPGAEAERERRTYTFRSLAAARRKAAWLGARFPNCPLKIRSLPDTERSPVC